MGGALAIGIAFLVIGLIGLAVFPWGGVVVALVGAVIVLGFVLGAGRRSTHPRSS